MKRVILVRHGKSSWKYDVADRDRPLQERGINDAHLVSKKFENEKLKIDFAFSSPANRALHTAMIFLRNLKYNLKHFRVDENLYDFSGSGVQSHIQSLDDNISTVMVFGHNYAFTNLANTWGDQYIENVTTSGLVQVRFDEGNWKSIAKGKTEQVIFPRHLK
ncbi:histidine phosphatase family protein [Allomuricauda sp. SCSIO 65647]|uniref:SixA phosphatase family protein n=1 Tax=Allomuricauda sp. SCSIO 65647 TaxID=2908843 RepID=UPI001F2D1B55|nr:histidine phosphatase family protein [Muricauda sp. SCSIO 65647]UJH66929.1 histidine phosphatase family protein [Muricauda sp. SCSIO 65647]